MLLQEAVDEFLTDCRAGGLAPKTLDVYAMNLRLFCGSTGEIDLANLQVSHARHFLADLQERDLSPYTVDQYYRTLNTFFRWCVREGVLGANPIVQVRRPRLPKHIVHRLRSEQVMRLIEVVNETALHDRNLAIVLLMVDSGLRVGEVVGIRRGDLNLQDSYVQVNGKGNKDRQVPLGEITKQALVRYLQVRRESDSRYVFLNKTGSAMTVMAVQLVLRRLADKVGVERLHPHLLRHTFAKLYMEEGDVKTLQMILGHASAETTTAIYLDPDIEDLKRQHRRAGPVDRLYAGKAF